MDTQALLSKINIPEKESIDLIDISRIKQIDKYECYITQGQVPQKFAIIRSGLFRYYYIDREGNEFTKGFITEGNVLSSYSAMLHQTPSHFFIQALEHSEILDISYTEWLILQENNPYWDKFLISALQKGYCTKEKRERELLLLDAERRYHIFLKEFPDLEKRVKLQTIASYLGIRPESLSRIRKKMMN
ncbi:Crp/Fnr family transcriptional regulator [Aquimarina sp. I32.4]|uniref:Crp/Fnr family transcriptional regulator n=1 Tax=Aquimarina sp. I32.4 TaxID=2053903 RepID=UPI000CDE833A|nr:Crp/Fnr family transcriptional regulator [Aquimarina sp. I32.4]